MSDPIRVFTPWAFRKSTDPDYVTDEKMSEIRDLIREVEGEPVHTAFVVEVDRSVEGEPIVHTIEFNAPMSDEWWESKRVGRRG